MRTLFKQISNGAESLGLEITEEQISLMINYLDLLAKWNRRINLTSIRGANQMVTRHLLDSLSIAPYIKGQRILDAGTGAGLPGIPLAIFFPTKEFTLLDSHGKKTHFLNQVKFELNLKNIEIINDRAESFKPTHCFECITSRAFSSLNVMIEVTKNLCCSNGEWLAMKGQYPEEELVGMDYPYKVVPLTVPGLDEARHLVIINRE